MKQQKQLLNYAKAATRAITGLTAGGSEYFGKEICGFYTADLDFCVERIRSRMIENHELRVENINLKHEIDRLKMLTKGRDINGEIIAAEPAVQE